MAKPEHAIDVGTLANCQIDLYQLQSDDPENPAKPCYMYAITRIPMAPGEMHQTGREGFCSPKFLVGSSGVDDLGVSYRNIADSLGSFNLCANVLGPAEVSWLLSRSTSSWKAVKDQESPRYAVVEIELVHQNISATQDDLAVNGMWCTMQSRYDYQSDPIAIDSLEMYSVNSAKDHCCYPNDFASAWDMMSGFSLSLNNLTYQNSGGFGCGAFAVPWWGWPQEEVL